MRVNLIKTTLVFTILIASMIQNISISAAASKDDACKLRYGSASNKIFVDMTNLRKKLIKTNKEYNNQRKLFFNSKEKYNAYRAKDDMDFAKMEASKLDTILENIVNSHKITHHYWQQLKAKDQQICNNFRQASADKCIKVDISCSKVYRIGEWRKWFSKTKVSKISISTTWRQKKDYNFTSKKLAEF